MTMRGGGDKGTIPAKGSNCPPIVSPGERGGWFVDTSEGIQFVLAVSISAVSVPTVSVPAVAFPYPAIPDLDDVAVPALAIPDLDARRGRYLNIFLTGLKGSWMCWCQYFCWPKIPTTCHVKTPSHMVFMSIGLNRTRAVGLRRAVSCPTSGLPPTRRY